MKENESIQLVRLELGNNLAGEQAKHRPATRLGGILIFRQHWGLSWRGWSLMALIGLAAIIAGVLSIYPFLAVTERVNANTLVMEGWVHTFAAQGAIAEFRNGRYGQIIVTGGPVRGNGGYTTDYDTSAHVGAGELKALGIPRSQVQMVPSHTIGRDRTYHSALALREWLRRQGPGVAGLNVVTESVHARRTRFLFSRALGPNVKVGIIAVPDPDYDSTRWWNYSEGVREVIGETIAYVYARLFFHPPPPDKALDT